MSAIVEFREAQGKLLETRKNLSALMEKKGEDGRLKWTDEDHGNFAAWSKKAADEHAELKKWEAICEAAKQTESELKWLESASSSAPFGGPEHKSTRQPVTFGEAFTGSASFKAAARERFSGSYRWEMPGYDIRDLKNGGMPIDAEFKTTMTTAAGFAPFSLRTGDVVPYAIRIPMIADLMPQITTDQNAVVYMEETTRTANAAATSEGSALPESARAYTQRTVNIEDVGTSLPITDRELDDVPALMGIINASLGMEGALAEETQLLTGTGTTPQLRGFLSTAAASAGVQTQAVGTDDAITAVQKAMTLVMATGFANPSAVVYHPTNWQNIITLKDSLGRFIFGDPSQAGPRTLWGLPAIVTTAITLNTALTGDFALYSRIHRRRNLLVEMGFVNTDFTQRQRTLRVYSRLALVLRRPSAFCKITGMP